MRGRTFILLLLAACGSDDDAKIPAPSPATDAGTDGSSSPLDGGSSSPNDSGTSAPTDSGTADPQVCTSSTQCRSRQCQPDGTTKSVPTGTCVENGSCVFIPESGKPPRVDDHCTNVEPCLGFVCVPIGIIAAPTGIFACGIPGEACTKEAGSRCCYSDCPSDGKCPQP